MTAPAMELRRAQEASPTEPGWWYGQAKDKPRATPIPWLVVKGGDTLAAFAPGLPSDCVFGVEQFNWFGAVPTCVESGK